MSELGRPHELSRRQRTAVDLLASGASAADVARVLGVTVGVVTAWRRTPRFSRALSLARPGTPPPNLVEAVLGVFERASRRGDGSPFDSSIERAAGEPTPPRGGEGENERGSDD